MKELSKETQQKILQVAANILRMHGEVVGNRVCQDWSGEESDSPESLLTENELSDISYNYELVNSNGYDYDPGYHWMHDEMIASFAIAQAIESMIED
ncbi:hypothetical protein CL622_02800 [archaeon]|nr:hypothetical protein [archaeon]